MATTHLLDLRDSVRSLVSDLGQPDEIWLFGSRAQRTGSIRSDVDLLIVDRDAKITTKELVDWRRAAPEREPLDLFISRDSRAADSVVNGSALRGDSNHPKLLGAQLIWSAAIGGTLENSSTVPWVQEFSSSVSYQMTLIPTDFTTTLSQLPGELRRLGLPDTLMGTDWATVASRCIDIASIAVGAIGRLNTRASNLNKKSAYPEDEYDAQNLFFLALRPWFPDLEINPFEIKYAGQKKFADLAGAESQLVLEIKYVADQGSGAAVLKQLSGLANFYEQPSHTKAVIFLLVISHGVKWDASKIDHSNSFLGRHPVILTRSILLPDPSG